MKAIEILYNLNPYQQLLDGFYAQLAADKTFHWHKKLKSQYSFITLQVYRAPLDDIKQKSLVLEISFETKGESVVLEKVYSEDKTKTDEWLRLIKNNKAVHDAHWHKNPNNTWYHDQQLTAYINIADDIAGVAFLCSSGDDYRPGFYSEITIDEECIRFSQVNRHNAKSLDHKNDYFLRDLYMTLPLDGKPRENKGFGDRYQIGALSIELEDRSSEKNKTCGDAILQKIQQEQIKFEQTRNR